VGGGGGGGGAMANNEITGSGWAFPVMLNGRGGFAIVSGAQDIEQALRIIILTPKGQRPRRPEFGCRIHDLIFAPNDAATARLAENYVAEALALWEPRINVKEVQATPDPENDGCLLLAISYEIKATHDRRALVVPFYRIPDEA
jgi:uncharacterized protein